MTSNGPTEHISIALVVDDDLGFVWWFGEIFFRAGYQVVPALSCREAISRVKELDLRVDLVLVNPKLRGVSRMLRLLKQPAHGAAAVYGPQPARARRMRMASILLIALHFFTPLVPGWVNRL
jgi:hypothetical protein